MAGLPEEQKLTYRYIEAPIDWGCFLDAEPTLPARGLFRAGSSGSTRAAALVPGLNHMLWAGCRDNQTLAAAQIGGVIRGVFTYCFCRALRSAGPAVTRRRLDALVSAAVRTMDYSQVPQLEGTAASLGEKHFS